MWKYVYRDYPQDAPWNLEHIEPGKGMIGCEMHEINGWQERQHREPRYLKKEKPHDEDSL